MRSHTRRASREREDGAAAVEFALVLVPLLVVMFGMIQYGLYFYSSQVGSSTAREAVRRLAVGDCETSADLLAFVQARLGDASMVAPTISTVYTDANDVVIPGGRADAEVGGKVTVSITFQSLNMNFPFVPVPNEAKITREVDARMEDLDSSGCA